MICTRCEEPIMKYTLVTLPNKSGSISTIVCSACNSCMRIKLKDKWENIQQVLRSGEERNGWIKVTTTEESTVHYVLNKILYEQCEPPEKQKFESTYDLPDTTDIVKILWSQGVAIGFYTLKLKGTLNEETGCKYEMTTLDTAYIRSSCRRKGYGTSILKDLVTDHPNQDIGLSKPISTAMWNVLYKFLLQNSQYRLKFWEIGGAGKEGNRTVVWYSVKSKNRIRSNNDGEDTDKK